MKEHQHGGIIEQVRDTDYFAGALPFEIRIPSGDWTPYLPEFEWQKIGTLETDACVPFAAVQSVVAQINYFIATSQLPAYHLARLKDLGFITEDGKFHASERFIAKMDGTTERGTAMVAPWDAIRKFGMLPDSDWPFHESMTWNEFYKPVPAELLTKAQEFLKLFGVQYEWIAQGFKNGTPVEALKKHLQHAPLAIGTPVCEPWNTEQPPTCSGQPSAHSTMAYRQYQFTFILDHYSPFLKKFALDYPIPFVMKGVVNILPVVPPLPEKIEPTVANVERLTILQFLYQQLVNLVTKFKGRFSSVRNK